MEGSLVVGPKPSEPLVVDVRVEGACCLVLTYETGEKKRFDVAPWFKGEFLDRLSDERYFKQTRVIDGGIAVGWPKGPDIGPEDLYELSEPLD